jgi:hypothetical protein
MRIKEAKEHYRLLDALEKHIAKTLVAHYLHGIGDYWMQRIDVVDYVNQMLGEHIKNK